MAKLILLDGQLREFAHPVKVSDALQDSSSSSFVCHADEMKINSLTSALPADDELRPGQIYFVLPASMLRRTLRVDELAVKASSALTRAGGGGGRRKGSDPFWKMSVSPRAPVFAEPPSKAAAPSLAKEVMSRPVRMNRSGGGKGRDFVSSLATVPE